MQEWAVLFLDKEKVNLRLAKIAEQMRGRPTSSPYSWG